MGLIKTYLINFCALTAIILLFSSTAASLTAVNSNDWKDTFHGIQLSHFENKESFVIGTPNDIQLISNSEKEEIELKSSSEPVISDLDRRLQSEGLQIDSDELNWKNQYSDYEDVKENVSGFVIVPKEFSSDAVTAFPKVIQNNYYVLFYDDRTSTFLESKKKPTIFLGEFPSQPWKSINLGIQVINKEDRYERNRLFISKFLDGNTVMLSDIQDIDVESITTGKPILFKSDIDSTSSFIESEEYNAVEILGPENLFYGQRLKNSLDYEPRFVVKTARTFTGLDLSGKQFPLKQIDLDTRKSDVSIHKMKYDSRNGRIGAVFSNQGNAATEIEIDSIGKKNISRTLEISPEQKLTYSTKLETVPNDIEVIAFSKDERVLGPNGLQPEEVHESKINIDSNVDIETVYFNRTSSQITIDVKTEKPQNLKIGLTLDNRSYFTDTVKIDSSEKIVLPHYFDDKPSEAILETYEGEKRGSISLRSTQRLNIDAKPKNLSDKLETILLASSIVLIILVKIILIREKECNLFGKILQIIDNNSGH